jgi:hypothetical protein
MSLDGRERVARQWWVLMALFWYRLTSKNRSCFTHLKFLYLPRIRQSARLLSYKVYRDKYEFSFSKFVSRRSSSVASAKADSPLAGMKYLIDSWGPKLTCRTT